jgi:ketosteroid isomerase-like protein
MERGDIPTVLALCDPEIEFDNSNAVFDPPSSRARRRLDFFSRSADMWEAQRFEAEEFIPVGEDQVRRAADRQCWQDEVETVAHSASLYTFREGKAVHIKTFQTKAEALEAAGLSE